MNPHQTHQNMFDGFDRWFFGGDPGPQDADIASALTSPIPLAIDQNDALIPAFKHRCDCGQHTSLLACVRKNIKNSRPQETDVLAPLHF